MIQTTCYTCGEFTPKVNQKLISDFYKNAYRAYFQVELGNQDKKWAPHIVCSYIPMIWREPQNHFNDCYLCSVSIA